MRAAIFREPGDPATVLTVQDVAPPEPASGEVVVDVDASVIQPADLMFIRGSYRIRPTFPQVAGLEGTGLVVSTGAGVAITLGTRVAFRHAGTWAERVAVPAERCYIVPGGVAIDTAAQFALNPVTAWALLDELTVAPGDWIAVSALRSAIARLVTAIAERRGQLVLGLSRPGNHQPLPFPTIDADDHLVSRIRPNPRERAGGVSRQCWRHTGVRRATRASTGCDHRQLRGARQRTDPHPQLRSHLPQPHLEGIRHRSLAGDRHRSAIPE
jgi:hypothetical protein